ncbi:MAG: hypothetical protein QMD36_04890 [Candidatus Aenigmarchaeota archaeon]|nr:hypothetical protein [Candidatus Aenigmarchaeota archaeon]
MSAYPPFPYQVRKQYEDRLTDAFPTEDFISKLFHEVQPEIIDSFDNFAIEVEVTKLEKTRDEAESAVHLFERYLEAAFPKEGSKKIKKCEPIRMEKSYEYSIPVVEEENVRFKERKMVAYSRTYRLDLTLRQNKAHWLRTFFTSFFYSRAFHKLDKAIPKLLGKKDSREILLFQEILTKVPFRMPLYVEKSEEDTWKFEHMNILKDFIFSSQSPIPYLIVDQMKDRHPFVYALTHTGEPIPRRNVIGTKNELEFNEPADVVNFFLREYGVEYYRSVDRKSREGVDTIVIEYDPGPRVNLKEVWGNIIKDEEKSLEILIEYGINPKSIETNYSGHKSLQRLIHINPPVTYDEARLIQAFLSSMTKFEAAKDPYMYTTDKDGGGASRVTSILVDWDYGRKKEIKCVPTPNIKIEPIHLSIPLRFSYKKGEVKFHKAVYDFDIVKEFSHWKVVLLRLKKEKNYREEDKLYRLQHYYETHASHPDAFRKLMNEKRYLVEAVKEIKPSDLYFYRKEWLMERFA